MEPPRPDSVSAPAETGNREHFAAYLRAVASVPLAEVRAAVVQVIGLILESTGLRAAMGEVCRIYDGSRVVGWAEVVGFRKHTTLLMPVGELAEIRPGLEVEATGRPFTLPVGEALLGRVLNGLGQPLDDLGPLTTAAGGETARIFNAPPNPLSRRRIREPMVTGIRSIDAFRTLGKGQRVGLFAGSGVGKSVLLGMIARNCQAAVNVIALIGERGREVKEFIEKDLGPEGLKRSVVFVATSDQPALVRLKAALSATAVAEWFRDRGKDVMLLMDSSTRLAMAQREIGLAVGEPPSSRGYTPSVFAFLPKLFERAGMGAQGSITSIYTVLVEGDDMDEPVADAVRSILDGHIVLSRSLAHRNHYPAIDVLQSVSRCMPDVIEAAQKEAVAKVLRAMAVYRESEDLVNLGAYARGTNPELDKAIALSPELQRFLIQAVDDRADFPETLQRLQQLAAAVK